MFYQIFLSPQVKRWAIISYKHGMYELVTRPSHCRHQTLHRTSRWQTPFKIGAFKNLDLQLYEKDTAIHVFSFEYCKILKNTFIKINNTLVAASEIIHPVLILEFENGALGIRANFNCNQLILENMWRTFNIWQRRVWKCHWKGLAFISWIWLVLLYNTFWVKEF